MHDTGTEFLPLIGNLHRHGRFRVHSHPHAGPHEHLGEDPRAGGHSHSHDHAHAHHEHGHDHGHSHGLVDDAIKRSRAGVRAVGLSFAVLGVTAAAQTLLFALTGSVALLADLIHNFGDALTAVPLAIAFIIRSERAERYAGLGVVAAIFISAWVAGAESIHRLFEPTPPDHLLVLGVAGAIGCAGNFVAAQIRLRAGRVLNSPALTADGHHARADAYVSLAVIASAAVVAIGLPIADPLIGMGITVVILRITWQSWRVIRTGGHDR